MTSTTHVLKLMLPMPVAQLVELTPFTGSGTWELEPAHKLHITLAFLGKRIAGDQLRAVDAACAATAEVFAPINTSLLELRRFTFPKREVIWAAVQEVRALHELREDLVRRLKANGVQPDDTYDKTEWTPHVTLARCPPGSEAVKRHQLGLPVTFDAITYKVGDVENRRYAL